MPWERRGRAKRVLIGAIAARIYEEKHGEKPPKRSRLDVEEDAEPYLYFEEDDDIVRRAVRETFDGKHKAFAGSKLHRGREKSFFEILDGHLSCHRL
jgi:hypothetical protein